MGFMKRLLFVDDETAILEGLKRTLHAERNRYEMVFVSSGQKAMEELKKSPFDVIISDMKMPGIDGKKLLEHAKKEYPHIVRIILSGFSEFEEALRVVM